MKTNVPRVEVWFFPPKRQPSKQTQMWEELYRALLRTQAAMLREKEQQQQAEIKSASAFAEGGTSPNGARKGGRRTA